MPRAVIDLRMLRGRLHGIARYALELARRLPSLAPDWEFIGLTGPDGLPASIASIKPQIELVRCPAGFLSVFEQPALVASLIRLSCDVFHATSFSVPALWSGDLVVTLHDVNHLVFPEDYGPGRVAYYRLIVGPRIKRARAVLTDSEFSRAEISKHLGVLTSRIEVIHPGVAAIYQPPDGRAAKDFRAKHGLPQSYWLAVGNTKPHKNLGLLALVAEKLCAPIALLAGAGAKRDLGFPGSAIELNELPEEEMPLLYGSALALFLPSRYEGFGLPAIEAMACGCPVIASNASSLAEVIGEAGILVPPDAPDHWVQAARRILNDVDFRREVADKGQARAAQFSWDGCASRVLAAYQRSLSTKAAPSGAL